MEAATHEVGADMLSGWFQGRVEKARQSLSISVAALLDIPLLLHCAIALQ